jgi:hypothetical protein
MSGYEKSSRAVGGVILKSREQFFKVARANSMRQHAVGFSQPGWIAPRTNHVGRSLPQICGSCFFAAVARFIERFHMNTANSEREGCPDAG